MERRMGGIALGVEIIAYLNIDGEMMAIKSISN